MLLNFRKYSDILVDMTELNRILSLPSLLQKKSFFLFGPRATGKSFLIQHQLSQKSQVFDLLSSDLALRLSAHPSRLESLIEPKTKWVVIDEIQKVPSLLDEVHRLIEKKKYHFLLTGSSARKLKRGQANLLAGRAWNAELFPLSWAEIPNFNLERYLRYGGLPSVYLSQHPEEELKAYCQTYLYEEIQAEGFVRRLPQFSRFLLSSALSNTKILNFTKIGQDAEISPSTVREYFQILEDTLMGFQIFPWKKSKRRKTVSTSKFYFFDLGVANTLANIKTLDPHSDLYGLSFEHWIACELKAYLSYRRKNDPLEFWRTKHHQEVDFIVGDQTAIEVKATQKINEDDLKGLKALQEEKQIKNYYLISHDPIFSNRHNIRCLHWSRFIKELWNDKIL